jgi:tRNA (cytidine56-2'-O)-methyltransferase
LRVFVVRLGHRHIRDQRTTTHLFLTARAFGADGIIYFGQRDKELEVRIKEFTNVWGGPFEVKYGNGVIEFFREWQENGGEIVHLTMYGLLIQNVIEEIRNSNVDKLIVVGGSKVPSFVYNFADWNVAVTSQPHSEISALSVFLHELFEGQELLKTYRNAKLDIVPQTKGKKVVNKHA